VHAVDVEKLIRELNAQKEKLMQSIALLEELAAYRHGPPPFVARERRGRKSMGADERREVSKRMKKYWAARRKQGE
jgi:hypothetical protein